MGYNGVEEMPNTQEAIFALVHPDDLEYVSQEQMAALSDICWICCAPRLMPMDMSCLWRLAM